MNLQESTVAAIEKELGRFPDKQSAMMNVLHLVQDDIGYVSEEAITFIAGKLEVPPVKVLEVVTFYPMYRQKPVGKVHISICRTLSCALCGSYTVREKLRENLGCDVGEVSEDGRFSLDWGECLGSCGTGPVVHVNGSLYENVQPESIESFVETLRAIDPESPNLTPEPGTPAWMG